MLVGVDKKAVKYKRRARPQSHQPEAFGPCFLCAEPGENTCEYCGALYCTTVHGKLHRRGGYCFPYKVGFIKGKGRVLFATRDIRPLELVLVDPGTVVGPNYRSAKVCIECLRMVEDSTLTCCKCSFPLCGVQCEEGPQHALECDILARAKNIEDASYAHVTVLRLLLLSRAGADCWTRTNQLMDHLAERSVHPQEWVWYTKHILEFIRSDLDLGEEFTVEQVERAIGLLNVNAVCLQFSKYKGTPCKEVGKGMYPIFAIMSHECICNTRYIVDPKTFHMYVRARMSVRAGEELTVQYLSALWGNMKRRRKIKEEWYFDCMCRRCSDPTECGSYTSAVKCFECNVGNLLPLHSLDYESDWSCSRCTHRISCSRIQVLVEDIEAEFDSILGSGEYWKYKDAIDRYTGSILHPSHWILTTARRNLIQYLCYSRPKELHETVDLRTKYKLCDEFCNVLKKVDPGWSELSMFAQREFHFTKLDLLKMDYTGGSISLEEFSVKSRNSIEAVERITREREFLIFDDARDTLRD